MSLGLKNPNTNQAVNKIHYVEEQSTFFHDYDPDPLLFTYEGSEALRAQLQLCQASLSSCFALSAQKAAGRPRPQHRLWRGTRR